MIVPGKKVYKVLINLNNIRPKRLYIYLLQLLCTEQCMTYHVHLFFLCSLLDCANFGFLRLSKDYCRTSVAEHPNCIFGGFQVQHVTSQSTKCANLDVEIIARVSTITEVAISSMRDCPGFVDQWVCVDHELDNRRHLRGRKQDKLLLVVIRSCTKGS